MSFLPRIALKFAGSLAAKRFEEATRDPVATAEPSTAVKTKKAVRMTADGLPVHSFDSLLEALGTRCRNTCRVKAAPANASFSQVTEPTPLQARAYQLLGL